MLRAVHDGFGRALRALRLSVTDRCNLRCRYCMPEDEYVWLPRQDLLSFEELDVLAAAFCSLGVVELRLTGGEPLLRRDLATLVAMLRRDKPNLEEVTLTTNGVDLVDQATALRQAGLGRLTISLDTLRRERFQALTGRDEFERVLQGVAAAAAAGFTGTKINTVVQRGVNDDELEALLAFGREHAVEVRFIEYMDVGGATRWGRPEVVSKQEMVTRLRARAVLGDGAGSAPARSFVLPDGTRFGIIASVTEPFCRACDRARLTADGVFFTCLYGIEGVDLRGPLRQGDSAARLVERVETAWGARRDKGAEDRAALVARGPLVQIGALAKDPHLEMHTRGG